MINSMSNRQTKRMGGGGSEKEKRWEKTCQYAKAAPFEPESEAPGARDRKRKRGGEKG